MGIHYRMPALRLVAPGGPVTRALAVMTTADPDIARIRALRRSIAERIEADIALLDALSGDPDLEDVGDGEPSLGAAETYLGEGTNWTNTMGGRDRECEDEHDEDGGDHEDEVDAEVAADDNGIADHDGRDEQYRRFLARGFNLSLVQGDRR